MSPDNPAKPGEIVHFYFTGLGAVAPPIATGAVTPVGTTLYRVQTPLTCQFRLAGSNQTFPADILFAGLAPGTVGVEQVDMRVPVQASAASWVVECQSQQTIGTIGGIAQLPIQ